MMIRVAGADRDELQNARIAIAIDHATRATVADKFRGIELVNAAHRLFPKVTAIQVQIPVEVKIFVPAKTAELLALAAQMALHLVERLGRIHHREAAGALHVLDLLKNLDEFIGAITHQGGIAKTEVTGAQGRKRVAERAAFEAEFAQERRQLVIVLNEFA